MVFDRGGGKFSDVSGEAEGAIKPEMEPHAGQIAAIFGNKTSLSVQMGEPCLVKPTMPLLGGITVGDPDLGLMAIHRVTHDLTCAGEVGGMNNGFGRTKHPLVGIASFDPHTWPPCARSITMVGYTIGGAAQSSTTTASVNPVSPGVAAPDRSTGCHSLRRQV